MDATSRVESMQLIRDLGADLVVVPGAYAEAAERAAEWQQATGAMQIHAYDAPATVEGQGTCMAEWETQGLQAETVLIAVGGGGLIAGALASGTEEKAEGVAAFAEKRKPDFGGKR